MRQHIKTAVWKTFRHYAPWLFILVVVPSLAGTMHQALHPGDVMLEVNGTGQAEVFSEPDDPEIIVTIEGSTEVARERARR
jgi:hypothetical protein